MSGENETATNDTTAAQHSSYVLSMVSQSSTMDGRTTYRDGGANLEPGQTGGNAPSRYADPRP